MSPQKLVWRFFCLLVLHALSNFSMQSDDTNEEFTERQYLAVGERKVCQQTLPHAGLYVNHRVLLGRFELISNLVLFRDLYTSSSYLSPQSLLC